MLRVMIVEDEDMIQGSGIYHRLAFHGLCGSGRGFQWTGRL